jgi:ribosomal protein S18 acetylase RimI-like enzyme
MSGSKFLIDTNIVIGLEDPHPVKAPFAELVRKCSEHGVRLFIDGAAYDDIGRDRDPARQRVTLSKLEKFERLRTLPMLPLATLEADFGPIKSDNDHCDVRLLQALRAKAVDFLVTQDERLYKRGDRAGLGRSILSVEEALTWLQTTFEPSKVVLPFIAEKLAYQIDRNDPIFSSLRAEYSDFDTWFDKCARQQRACWVAEVDRVLAGLVIRKDESHVDAKTQHPGPKILKICTFKMKDEFRGEKFGEQLLKQILWYAQRNAYHLVYLTAYPRHELLIELLEAYGFSSTARNANGELVLEKPLATGPLTPDGDYLRLARQCYPRFWIGTGVQKFCVPIRAGYHRTLFPELAIVPELPLFPEKTFGRAVRYGSVSDRTPGNTIRKVYLCRAPTRQMRSGDVLLFYMSKDDKHQASQSITSMGVVARVGEASTIEELLRLIGKRSVFSFRELEDMLAGGDKPLKVIDFLLSAHLDRPVPLSVLQTEGVFRGHPPQTISALPDDRFARLMPHLKIGFEL